MIEVKTLNKREARRCGYIQLCGPYHPTTEICMLEAAIRDQVACGVEIVIVNLPAPHKVGDWSGPSLWRRVR